jgi:hypothetical protein
LEEAMMKALVVAVLTTSALISLVGPIAAAETFSGCFNCAERRSRLITAPPTYFCKHAGHNEHGTGTTCTDDGYACFTSDDPCYNVVVTGGGSGGTSGGGGGGTCAYDDSGYCAPWCGACHQV